MSFYIKEVEESDPSLLSAGWYVYQAGDGDPVAGPFSTEAEAAAVALGRSRKLASELRERAGELRKKADEQSRQQAEEIEQQLEKLRKQIEELSKRAEEPRTERTHDDDDSPSPGF